MIDHSVVSGSTDDSDDSSDEDPLPTVRRWVVI